MLQQQLRGLWCPEWSLVGRRCRLGGRVVGGSRMSSSSDEHEARVDVGGRSLTSLSRDGMGH